MHVKKGAESVPSVVRKTRREMDFAEACNATDVFSVASNFNQNAERV